MQTFRTLDDAAAADLRRSVVTLGVFDGVHVGHRLVLRHVVNLARERAGDAVVVTFDRHPRAIIQGRAPQAIHSLDHRLERFGELGIDAALVLDFGPELRAMEPEDFARRVFGEVLRAEVVLLGYNNRFGKGGRGDLALLKRVGEEVGFEARALEELRIGSLPVSSTAIRDAVLAGRLEDASLMLGRPFAITGEVVHGDAIGRQIGFPTANLDLDHELRPPRGVYGIATKIEGQRRFGLMNIGVRPTVDADSDAEPTWEERLRDERIEVHLLDFDGDLYGQSLEVALLVRIREEKRFPGLRELQHQISADRDWFRSWIARGHPEGT